jgi:hypothetical protein
MRIAHPQVDAANNNAEVLTNVFMPNDQHQRQERAASDVHIVAARPGPLLSAACCGSAFFSFKTLEPEIANECHLGLSSDREAFWRIDHEIKHHHRTRLRDPKGCRFLKEVTLELLVSTDSSFQIY